MEKGTRGSGSSGGKNDLGGPYDPAMDRDDEWPAEKRHIKRRRNLTPAEKQAQNIEQLFDNPTSAMRLPSPPPPVFRVRPPPDMVPHVQGSSSGVGSGEFHVYKMTRRNESDRINAMKYEADRAAAQEEFNKKRAMQAAQDEAKTSKNRTRREKKKQALQRARQANETETLSSGDVPGNISPVRVESRKSPVS